MARARPLIGQPRGCLQLSTCRKRRHLVVDALPACLHQPRLALKAANGCTSPGRIMAHLELKPHVPELAFTSHGWD